MAKDSIDIKLGQLDLTVEGVYIPLRRGIHTLANGDPGYPDEPAEFEITTVLMNKIDVSDLLNEVDTFYYTSKEFQEKHISIWEKLSEIALEEYEKLID